MEQKYSSLRVFDALALGFASNRTDGTVVNSRADLFASMVARVIDGGVEDGLLTSSFREPPSDAKVKAESIAKMAPHYFGETEGAARAFVGEVARLTNGRDEDGVPYADPDDAQVTLDRLIAKAREIDTRELRKILGDALARATRTMNPDELSAMPARSEAEPQ